MKNWTGSTRLIKNKQDLLDYSLHLMFILHIPPLSITLVFYCGISKQEEFFYGFLKVEKIFWFHWVFVAALAFSSWDKWSLLFIAVHRLQWLWHRGLVASKPVGFPQTRDRICVPCIGKQILNHWTTREVLKVLLLMYVEVFHFLYCDISK